MPRDLIADNDQIIADLRADPDFAEITDKMWFGIQRMWDTRADGKPLQMKEIAQEVGVSQETISRWRARRDFLMAHEAFGRAKLMVDAGAYYHAARKLALQGDKQMLKFFMEKLFPDEPKNKEENRGSGAAANVFAWIQSDPGDSPVDVIDAESTETP